INCTFRCQIVSNIWGAVQLTACPANLPASRALSDLSARLFAYLCQRNFALRCFAGLLTDD
ncbi:hypothetical protein ACEOAJ_01590, partial [Escherichia coli]|uniref:hypothetical protein n=1 Tax=Escherichia coli TaxID=562 RepID=UPI00358DB1D7